MNRRSLAQSVGRAALLSALANAPAEAGRSRRRIGLYRLEYLYFSQARQAHRFDEFLASQIPLLVKTTQTLEIFSVVIGPHVPATVVLSGFEGFEEMDAADDRIRRSSEYQSVFEKMGKGFDPPFHRAAAGNAKKAVFLNCGLTMRRPGGSCSNCMSAVLGPRRGSPIAPAFARYSTRMSWLARTCRA
jgi:hypothetical protein